MPRSLLAPVGKSFGDAVSLNFGTIAGGITVNMKADHCRVGLDFRVPLGKGTDEILNVVREVVSRHDGTFHLDNSSEPNKSDANGRVPAGTSDSGAFIGVAGALGHETGARRRE